MEPNSIVLFCDVKDPKRESINLRDLIREALTHRDVSEAIAEIVGNGEDLGHKVLIWDAAWAIIEEKIGDRLESFNGMTRYEKGGKLRAVVRERLEVGKDWKITGHVAKRLASPTA